MIKADGNTEFKVGNRVILYEDPDTVLVVTKVTSMGCAGGGAMLTLNDGRRVDDEEVDRVDQR